MPRRLRPNRHWNPRCDRSAVHRRDDLREHLHGDRFNGCCTRVHPAALVGRSAAAAAALLLMLLPAAAVRAASPLLESVKQNPALARQMCARFKQLNGEGQSATSPQSIAAVASSQGLSPVDAEVLITYVIGLNCPDVR